MKFSPDLFIEEQLLSLGYMKMSTKMKGITDHFSDHLSSFPESVMNF